MTSKRIVKPPPRAKPARKARSPALKSQLKSKAKASSDRWAGRAGRPRAAVQALLDAIRATPDDNELRLVYADALEETNELGRAELIRAHIAALREPLDSAIVAHAVALQIERDKALARYGSSWKSDRGLVWHVEARVEDWLAHGAQLFETEPITSMVVTAPRDETVDDEDFDYVHIMELAKQPWLAWVHTLEIPLYSVLGEPDVVVELLGSPHLWRMAQLRVGDPLTAIAAAKHCKMPALTTLLLHCEGSLEGDDALRAYADRRDALTHLELVGCGVSAAGIRTIVDAGWKLERLVTAGTHYQADDIDAAGLQAVANAASLASLRELSIESAGLDDAAVRALAGSPHLRALSTLSLFDNHAITDAGLAALAVSPVLASVRALDLTATAVTEAGVAMLPRHIKVQAPHFR